MGIDGGWLGTNDVVQALECLWFIDSTFIHSMSENICENLFLPLICVWNLVD